MIYQILITISTQFIGFSLAGLTRRFLIYPHTMIWPGNLATIVLNRSFHNNANPIVNGWRISQFRMFLIIFIAYGIYFIFPDVLFQSLSTFNWITWIAPQNVKLALICGSVTGLGLSPLTTSPEFTLDIAKYKAYSPVYQSFFSLYTSTVSTVYLYYSKEIMTGIKSALQRQDANQGRDLHSRLMKAYPEVPEWWFFSVFVVSAVFGIVAQEVYHTEFPIWGMAIGVGMAFVFMIPIGVITAISNVQLTLNVLAELIGGYTLTGKPLAVMMFKAYGYVTTAQALGYASDLKMGHYLKIPPKSMFWAQLLASLVK
ncbi:hypothetical protein RQP46_002646 [Phenoliferia psychrophenolica]